MEKLVAYLAAAGLTQEAFASLGGWRQATISDWATGRRSPNVRNALEIERLTGGAVPISAWLAKAEAAS